MIDAPWLGYLLALVVSAVIALVLTPVAIRTAIRYGVLDHPGDHKSHASPTPYLGGVAMVTAFVVTILVAAAVSRPDAGFGQLAVILGAASSLAAIGLLDDLRGLNVTVRLGLQVAAAVALLAAGVSVNLFPGDVADALVTILWIVGITNAMNLLDNMDGLSAGIATIAALWFGLVAALNGQVLVGSLAFALAGCAAGFLRHNRPPARIYMGDAGSLFLGVMLAAIGIRLELPIAGSTAALVPILILTVPVMDTTLVVLSRIRHGISPLQGGRDHISHRLVRLGLPVPVAVATIVLLGFAHGWMALIVSRVDVTTALLCAGLVFTVDLLLFALLAGVPVYPASRGRDYLVTERPNPESRRG